ncbi:MAG: guanylate kinase [Defluviitaleaceae bacterium]|nr:guanylate kinase [Defluviitaleaceae bacterium]
MDSKGMLLIISGPSGSGKGTVTAELCKKEGYALSISYTTRDKRGEEVDGVHYFFTTEEEFHHMRESDMFLEHALFRNNFYATPRKYVEEQITNGKVVVLEIDVNGALQIKEKFPDAVLIFMIPRTLKQLEERLLSRKREGKVEIEGRLNRAIEEVELVDKYAYLVINNIVEETADEIDLIVNAEFLRPSRNSHKIKEFIGDDQNDA